MTAQCHILPRCLSAAQVSHDALRGVLKRAEHSPADKNNKAYSQWGKVLTFDNMSDN
jgi:hypothetical protein